MDYHGTEAIIIRENDAVFGDGCHESTQMVLEALYQQNPKGKKVLDVGTGTGIQAIFAKKWGAKKVLAVDVERLAIETARKNFEKNEVEVESRLNIYNDYLDFKADITVANLPPHNVVEFVPKAKDTMAKNGVLIFSWHNHFGLQEIDMTGYEEVDHLRGIDWDAYIVRRSE